jgi:hypothetical protein
MANNPTHDSPRMTSTSRQLSDPFLENKKEEKEEQNRQNVCSKSVIDRFSTTLKRSIHVFLFWVCFCFFFYLPYEDVDVVLFAVVCGHGGDGCAQRDLLADLNEP